MTLSNKQRQTLDNASRSAIRNAIPRLQKYWESSPSSWLSHGNPYRKNVVQEIKKALGAGKDLVHSHLSEYVAASAIIHCFDGWSYLGQALEAEMAGDPNVACHLGYYAELRAAMSLLASEGIGVFNNQHIIVTKAGKCESLRGIGTHEFAWKALKIWAQSQRAGETVFAIIKPESLPLRDWLDQFSAGAYFIPSKWLQQWGLDLSRLAEDREVRNLASYRPSAFVSAGPKSIDETMESIWQFWDMCEPGANGGFPVLDKHLLRISLKLTFKNQHRSSPKQAKRIYEKKIQGMLDGLPLPDNRRDQWKEFLNYEIEEEVSGIVSDAYGEDDLSGSNHSKQVMARATLLLRVATGSSADLLEEAGNDVRTKLKFWWHSPSVRRRLWAESHPPSSFQDLWSDIDDAMAATRQWISSKSNGQPACHHNFWAKHAPEASRLATTERAFLWGIGL